MIDNILDVPAVDLTAGIPQSAADPNRTLLGVPQAVADSLNADQVNSMVTGKPNARIVTGIPPWEVQDNAERKALVDRYLKGMDNIDAEVLADAGASAGTRRARVDLLAVNDAWLDLHSDEPVPPSGLGRKLAIQKLTLDQFGEGAKDDESLRQALRKDAQERRDKKAVWDKTIERGAVDETLTRDDTGRSGRNGFFLLQKEHLAGMPGNTPEEIADLAVAYSDTRMKVRASIARFRPQLDAVFTAFEAKEDYADAARAAYGELAPEDRKPFMAALKVRSKELSQKDQDGFFVNLFKSMGRNLGGMIHEGAVGTLDLAPTGEIGPEAKFNVRNAKSDKEAKKAFRDRESFVSDVVELQQETYDPLRYLTGDDGGIETAGFWKRLPEKVAYALPGLLGNVGAAIYAPPLLFASLTENHHQSLRRKFIAEGQSEQEAEGNASVLAPIGGALEFVGDRLGAGLLRGRLPFFDKALTGMMDRIKSPLARGVTRFGAGWGQGGAQEVGQNYIDPVVRELGAALQMDIGDVRWLGKGGELDGFWAQSIETFAIVGPLSIMGVTGGSHADARVKMFSEAPDNALLALGISQKNIDTFRLEAAKGLDSGNAALDDVLSTRDPDSDDAKAAVAEKLAEIETASRAKASGVVPVVIQSSDGFTVLDGETREVVASGLDQAGAERVMRAHSAAMDESRADQTAYMASLLEGGAEALEMDPTGKARNSIEVGTRYTEAIAAAEDAGAIDQFHEQAALHEQINGGTGEVAMVALGRNVMELRGKVRTFTNRLFQGASVTTIVHEMGHGMLRELEAAGVIVREEKLRFVRAVDTVMRGQVLKRGMLKGQKLALLPEGIADADITDGMLNEGISHILESELLRTRKLAKDSKALRISPGIISRNLIALSRMAPGATRKFRAFLEAARGVLGLSSARALAMKKALREGTLDKADYEAFLDKLTGRDLQAEHDGTVRDEHRALIGQEAFTPTENEPFSLAPAAFVDSLSMNVASRIKDPRVKAAMFTRMLSKLAALRRDRDELGIAFGKGYKKKAIGDPRQIASIEREAAFREAARRAELEDEANAKNFGILDQEDLAKLKEQPVHAALADPASPLRGRLMSYAAAAGRGINFFNPKKQGDYDGSDGVSRSVFGGTLAPDVAAEELFGAGLINAPTPDALWAALKREGATVEKMRGYMAAAREDLRKARLQAKEETKAWEWERLKEEAANYSPRQRLLRSLAMLDGILSVLPPEVRGRIGGYTQLAKLASDEARLKFLSARVALVEEHVDAWIKGEHRKELSTLREKARPKKNKPGEALRGRIGVDAHRVFGWVERYYGLDETQLDAELLAIKNEEQRLADEGLPGTVHPEALELANRARVLDLVGGFEDKSVADQAAALAWLRGAYTFGRDEWQAKEGERLAEVAGLQRILLSTLAAQKGITLPSFEIPAFDHRRINGMTPAQAEPLLRDHDTLVRNTLARHKAKVRKLLEEGGVGSLAARQERSALEASRETRTALEAGSGEFLSFVQVLERLLGSGHSLVTRWNEAVGQAQKQKTRAQLAADKAWLDAATAALGNPGRLKVQERLWEMSAEQSITIQKQIREPGVEMEIRLANVPGMLDGTVDSAEHGLTTGDFPALQEALDAHRAVDRGGRADTTEFLKFKTTGQRTAVEVKLSPMQAVTLVLTSRQARYAKNLELHGFTPDVVQSAVDQLGPEALVMADWLGEFYRDNYEPLAVVFRDMFGVDLPLEENYSPFRAERGGTDKEIGGPEHTAGLVPEGGFRANFTKTRAPAHSLAPALQGAVSVFQGHVANSEHWRAFAPLVREMKAVLGGLETRQAIEAIHGRALVSMLDGWLLAFEQNGLKQRKMSDGVDKLLRGMQRNIAVLGLAFRFSTLIKNYILPAFGTARRIGVGNWAHGMARFAAGKISYRAFREADYITLRADNGFSPELRMATSRMRSEKPTRHGDAVIQAMREIGLADARSTAVGAAIAWDYHFRRERAAGLSEADASAMADRLTEDDVRRTAQPLELAERSLYELSANDAARLLFLFATDARKESALFFEAARRAWKENGAAGLLTNAEFRTTAGAIWLTTGLINTVISRVLRDMMDGGDDDEWFDEKNWSLKSVLGQALLGPSGGIPLIRDLASGWNMGEMSKATRALKSMKELANALWHMDIPDDNRVMWMERRINKILIGLGLFHKGAAEAGAFSNLVDQSMRMIENADPL